MAKLFPIFAIVAESGAGKTTLIDRMLARFPDTLGVVRTVTTRARRSGESDRDYEFVSDGDFAMLAAEHRLIQQARTWYAGANYDNDRNEVNALLAERFGICAWVEPTVTMFRELGYKVVMIRIVPDGPGYANRSAERAEADRKRQADGPAAEKVILNSFDGKDGLDVATAMLAEYLEACMARENTTRGST